ncbi:MAG: hypothetical protein F4204_13330, partial [Rhodospirillaceae bacterium]|nr:hypothetical protein [Rhodospirillaceae bacterium]
MTPIRNSAQMPAGTGALAGVLLGFGTLLRSQGRIIWASGLGRVGAAIILFFAVVAILAPWIAP